MKRRTAGKESAGEARAEAKRLRNELHLANQEIKLLKCKLELQSKLEPTDAKKEIHRLVAQFMQEEARAVKAEVQLYLDAPIAAAFRTYYERSKSRQLPAFVGDSKPYPYEIAKSPFDAGLSEVYEIARKQAKD